MLQQSKKAKDNNIGLSGVARCFGLIGIRPEAGNAALVITQIINRQMASILLKEVLSILGRIWTS